MSEETVDLQGVAAFASLVEVLAQELGTTAGRIQGILPKGPAAFQELVGEITLDGQGFARLLRLLTRPGEPLRLNFCCWINNSPAFESGSRKQNGVEAVIRLAVPVEQVTLQGRALARYVEDMFKVMERLVSLGQSTKLSADVVSAADIAAFEQVNQDNLVSERPANRAVRGDSLP